MKRLITILMCCFMTISFTACGENDTVSDNALQTNTESSTESEAAKNTDIAAESKELPQEETSEKNILVAYFSLADEQYEVGVIEKGNTEIIAEIIAEKTGAELFKITANTDYPTTYEGLLDVSKQEESAPPELAENVANMADYNIVFIGYPIWWGDLPTIVKVFIESNDFSGKTVIPFCTHAGSGLSGTAERTADLCPDSDVGDGLAVRGTVAQNDHEAAENAVSDWLSQLGFTDQ